MARSMSIGNQIHRFNLCVSGARVYSGELPKEAARFAVNLDALTVQAKELGAAQEKAKQDLALLTLRLNQTLADGGRVNAQIVRLAEAIFGPRNPRMHEFRPTTEGKATKRAFQRNPAPEAAVPPPPVTPAPAPAPST